MAKTKATAIVEYWQAAENSITTAEKAVATKSGSGSDAVRGILRAAKEAWMEEPAEALHIANSIPAHIDSLESSSDEAEIAIRDAEAALNSAEGELALTNAERLEEAKEAFARVTHLSKGFADVSHVRLERLRMRCKKSNEHYDRRDKFPIDFLKVKPVKFGSQD